MDQAAAQELVAFASGVHYRIVPFWIDVNGQFEQKMVDQLTVKRPVPVRQARGAQAIYKELKSQIGSVYPLGALLPSTRMLAVELGVSRSTVTAAYEQLVAEGYIEVRHGARARASSHLHRDGGPLVTSDHCSAKPRLSAYAARLELRPTSAPPRVDNLFADFRYGNLHAADFPRAAWKRVISAVVDQQPAQLAYADPAGSPDLRRAVQGLLWRNRGIRCAFEQIIIVNGSQQGLDLCARVLLDPGDRFVIENPGYDSARRVFAATGAQAVPIPVDRNGLDTQFLSNVDAKLAYVTPSHQFPLGGVLPVARRQQLLDWATERGAYIVEDDYDSEYRYNIKPIPPLHGFDGTANVIYLGTVSKTLSPALRIGYLIVPPQLVEVFTAAKRLADRHSNLLIQDALADLIESGFYERHIRRMRRLNEERRTALLEAVQRLGDGAVVEGTDAGLHVVVWLRDLPLDRETDLVEGARALGVGIYPISPSYDPDAPAHRPDRIGLVLGYAGLPATRIDRGIELLSEAVDRLLDRPAR